jgi:hypothetical protein
MKKLSCWQFYFKILFSVVITVLSYGTINAQAPVITSFTPTSGPVGSSVTITGTNFSTTSANNIVWFGAVKATVTTSTLTQLTVIVPTGATYQPISVTVNGLTDYSNLPFRLTFSGTPVIDATLFSSKVDFATGTLPYYAVSSDIDGDGKPDIIVANYSSGTISIYRNTSTSGSISTGSFASKVDFATGLNPYCIAVGDVDGDGKPDVAVTNYASNSVSVFRNTAVPGSVTASSLAARVDFSTGGNPCGVVIGDIDGDGKSDLTVANIISGTVSIFRNTSTVGTITSGSFASRIDFASGSQPRYLTLGDIDADGKPDLVVTNQISSTISVFRNTSTSGSITSGSLAAKVDFATGSGPQGIAIGDLDGDSKLDLVVTNGNSSTISIFRNTSTTGSITPASFAAKVDFISSSGPFLVDIGDFDGDGKPELAVSNLTAGTISIFRNTSTSGSITINSFAAKVDFSTGTSPIGIAIGDFDGDGKPDLSVTNSNSSTVSVFRNAIFGPPFISGFTPTSGPAGTTVTITGNNFSPIIASNYVWFGAVRATVTAATISQLTVTVPGGATYEPIIVTNVTNGLSVCSATPFCVTFPSSQTINSASFASKVDFQTGTTPYYDAISDLDGDGKPDLVVVNYAGNSVSVFRNISTTGSISTASLATRIDFITGTSPSNIAIADIDGDGKPDMAVTNYNSNTVSVFRNTSISGSITTGSFAARVDFPTGANPNSVSFGDVDGDGKTDMVVSNYSGNSVSIFDNTGSAGSITSGSFAARVDFNSGINPNGVVITDIDGDLKPDLAVVNAGSNTISLFRNISSYGSITTSSFAPKVDFMTGSQPRNLAIGDIDGDGKQDLVIPNYSSNTVSVFKNTSTTGFVNAGSLATRVDFPTGSAPNNVSLGDLDGDGKPDMAVANYSGNTVSVLRNNYTSGSITAGSFEAKVDYSAGTGPSGVVIGDIDKDGKPDLSVINSISSTISILRNTIPVPTFPNPPVIGTATNVSANGFTGKWNSSATATGYRFDVSTNLTFTAFVTGYSDKDVGNVLYCNVSGLTPKTIYYYRVRAYNTGGTSGNSGTMTVTTLSSPPAAPAGLSATSCSNQVILKWRMNSDPYVYRYRVYGGLTVNPITKIDSTTLGISDTTKVLSGFIRGQTYYFRVTAVNSDGSESPFSNQASTIITSGVVPKVKSKFNNLLICYNLGDSIKSFQWYKAGSAISKANLQYYLTNKSAGSYYVETTDRNGCKNISNSVQISGTKSLIVYPNPASVSFTLKSNFEVDTRAEVSILNSAGIKVMQFQVENIDDEVLKEIPVKQLKEGIYTVRVVFFQEDVYSTKILVIK